MIEHGVKLPVIRQAEMLGLARSSVYYEPVPVPELDLAMKRRIDAVTRCPSNVLMRELGSESGGHSRGGGKRGNMTVRDSLAHFSTTDLRRAADALAATLPVGRTIKITPEAIEAATAGDVALLVTLFAAEVEPDEAELAALQDADDDGSRVSIADARRELGL